jgi:hypothetical protein
MEYRLVTLIDITATGQYRFDPLRQKEQNQQQNFDTILQTLGLRGNTYFDVKPKVIEVNGKSLGFSMNKPVKTWQFEWRMEIDDIFTAKGDPVYWLKRDFNHIPIIPNLDEMIVLKRPMLVTEGEDTNIIFSLTDK